MNARGSSGSDIVLWLAVAVACGVLIYWFMNNFFGAQAVIEIINKDLFFISSKINENCDSAYYLTSYNPFTEEGLLKIDSNSVCMESLGISKCAALYCGPKEDLNFDLSEIVYIELEKNQDFNVRGTT